MSPETLERYATLLEHADEPDLASRCGYGPNAVPVRWQRWEIAARFGTVVARRLERACP